MKLSELAHRLKGELIGKDAEFSAISTDSRSISDGQLFIALVGERFDAHDYLEQVKERGACAAVVSKQVDCDLPQVLVEDTLLALGEIGRILAAQSSARFIALTGSCGKTTTKEMIKLALSSAGQVYATRGNLNNHIGVPLTLSEVSPSDDYAVIEMGASGVGEIQYTVGMTHPDVVLITNASDAHIEGFGSLENIVQAKGEIVRYAPDSATVVLNADDPHFGDWLEMADTRRVICFSLSPDTQNLGVKTDVSLISKTLNELGGYSLVVRVGKKELILALNVAGEHMIQNALAALAVIYSLDCDVDVAASELAKFEPVKGRFYPVQCDGFRVWDDTYNANPQSVKAALETISSYHKPAWLVLGNMAELGDESQQAHFEIGQFAAQHGFNKVFAIGESADSVIAGTGFSGTAYNKTDMDVLLSDIKQELVSAQSLGAEVQILVKGSRSAGMERVVQALVEWDISE
ncbi:UDP-N-acetylmuramoyl-tripeptide--D-alanyl-D-alanine ligase [Litoribrevibacter euphylliae]|uniref:UDP-N-acetylmuramoyl-tripeptide--D-alanyl-D-alanine ligase n=1 Tax=Litoribrevibacter euphylliae TaxID=1834034 RepID=A0ABV7HIU1_9GAMM